MLMRNRRRPVRAFVPVLILAFVTGFGVSLAWQSDDRSSSWSTTAILDPLRPIPVIGDIVDWAFPQPLPFIYVLF